MKSSDTGKSSGRELRSFLFTYRLGIAAYAVCLAAAEFVCVLITAQSYAAQSSPPQALIIAILAFPVLFLFAVYIHDMTVERLLFRGLDTELYAGAVQVLAREGTVRRLRALFFCGRYGDVMRECDRRTKSSRFSPRFAEEEIYRVLSAFFTGNRAVIFAVWAETARLRSIYECASRRRREPKARAAAASLIGFAGFAYYYVCGDMRASAASLLEVSPGRAPLSHEKGDRLWQLLIRALGVHIDIARGDAESVSRFVSSLDKKEAELPFVRSLPGSTEL